MAQNCCVGSQEIKQAPNLAGLRLAEGGSSGGEDEPWWCPLSLFDGRRGRDSAPEWEWVGKQGWDVPQGSSDGEGLGCKAEALPGAAMPHEAAQNIQRPLEPCPGLWSPALTVAGRLLCHQVSSGFGTSNCCLSAIFKVFSMLQKFLKSEESRKHHPWDAALGDLCRGCRFCKNSCGVQANRLLIWEAEISMWNTPQSRNFPVFDPPRVMNSSLPAHITLRIGAEPPW